MRNRQNIREQLIKYFFGFNGITAVVILLGIFGFLTIIGLGAFREIGLGEFFFGQDWNPNSYHEPKWGILAMAAGTLYLTLGAMVIAVPVGLGTAIYLAEIASPRTREILKPTIELIATVPSVVLGLFGLIFLAPLITRLFDISSGFNALTASVLLAIMALPTIISISEDILREVPREFKEASYALGATKWETIKKVIIPVSSSGVLASVMLGLGRVIGETMLVLMIAGNARAFPMSILDPVRPLTANIAIEIKEVIAGGLHYQALFATGLLLLVITFIINLISDIIIEKQSKKLRL